MPDDERYRRGRERLQEIHGESSLATIESLGDLGRLIVEVAYGEVYSRLGCRRGDWQIATVARSWRPAGRALRLHPRSSLKADCRPTSPRGHHPDRDDRRAGDERDVDAQDDPRRASG
jgi:hypothetical protein